MFVHIHNPNQPALRRAFTLVELLMVIMLIGIMTSFVLVALAGAARTAQEDRTKAQILKIHELIMGNWEQYRYRRVPQTRLMREITNRPATGRQTQVMALERLNALRELMRMEMPSFMLDVTTPASKLRDMLTNQPYQPSVWRAYNRRAAAASWTVQYQDAECLYLILSQIRDADSSALEFFKESEITDLDGDGMKEIVDAWGNPIRWMLWAPSYISPLQVPMSVDDQQQDPFDIATVGQAYDDRKNRNNIPDAFEGEYWELPRMLYPLIYSAGPDGKHGIVLEVNDGAMSWSEAFNNPYDRTTGLHLLGAVSELNPDALADDISNHYLTTR